MKGFNLISKQNKNAYPREMQPLKSKLVSFQDEINAFFSFVKKLFNFYLIKNCSKNVFPDGHRTDGLKADGL